VFSYVGILLIVTQLTLTYKTGQITLERFNRTLNDKFETPHPSLLLFVQTIEIEAREQVQHLDDVRVGRAVPPALQETTINQVPHIYTAFTIVLIAIVIHILYRLLTTT